MSIYFIVYYPEYIYIPYCAGLTIEDFLSLLYIGTAQCSVLHATVSFWCVLLLCKTQGAGGSQCYLDC